MKVNSVGKMMREIIVPVILIAAVAVTIAASAMSGTELKSKIDQSRVQTLTTSADEKRLEDKMAEALKAYVGKRAGNFDNAAMSPDPANNSRISNSTFLNSSAANAPGLSSSENNATANGQLAPVQLGEKVTDDLENKIPGGASAANKIPNSTAPEGVGSSSRASFSGYYGIVASRHETGKSDVKSSTLLNGTFEMDKSVKFQDRGFKTGGIWHIYENRSPHDHDFACSNHGFFSIRIDTFLRRGARGLVEQDLLRAL
ncbi:Uncharacterised protein [uncultured archaeon]|nr:Uncharacterised protein [uncultured archaeon]